MPVPVYSARVVSQQNFAGNFNFENGTGGLIIIRTATVYYGGVTPMGWYLIDENNATMLNRFFTGSSGGDTNPSYVWINLHLCMPPGAIWHVSSSNGSDFTLHGYELSLP